MNANDKYATAFPCHGPSGQVFEYGLTKREWFAGMALQGIISGSIDKLIQTQGESGFPHETGTSTIALSFADAMLAALAEKGGES